MKLKTMFELQDKLNSATNGEDWVSGVTKNGKSIDWKRCIYMECAEVIDSFAWKHWKSIDAKVDYDNIKIEIVDIWHFVMSLAIEQSKKPLDKLVSDFAKLSGFEAIKSPKTSFAKDEQILSSVESIMFRVLDKNSFDILALGEEFFELVSLGGLNLDELYKLYIGKNILNSFRQDHGYKDGSYKKLWSGEEDNVVMKRVLDTNPSFAPDELYSELKRLYTN